MAYDYNRTKQLYEWLNDEQKQQFAEMNKNDTSWNYQRFMDQYNAEKNQTNNQTSTQSNFSNNQNTQTPTVQKTETQNNQTYNYDPNEKLDTSMFKESDGKVKVQEWTAQQTWMPDYQLDSDARTREITDNLNAYWQTNREYFTDRNTYNNMFHYNERSDQQKAVLDSYWKKKEDMDNASKYNTWDSINNWMKDAEITTDQLNYIKEMSPEAYREWQQKQQDDINLRIANMATPADPTDTAELFNSLMQKLNLEPWDPYQIYDNWYNMAERLWVFSDSEKLKSYQNQLDANHSKMESIMWRSASSTWWAVSDALAAARMNKALAPYQQREIDLQNSYTTLLNGRNSNLAIANQSANALAMQAQEDQRIWNQRLSWLWFAMQTASYRTPEQQAQLQLQTQQIQSDLNLLNQSKQNDLSLYNQKQLNDLNLQYQADQYRLQNKLQAELTDLSVTDEAQLRANLNNVLSDYYSKWWDIIQRPQSQVIDDVLAYAQKNNVSVAEALRKNFIEPLQNKKEYKQKIATSYGMLSQQSISTINWKSVVMTTNPDGTISFQYIDDPDDEWTLLDAKPYNQVDSRALNANPMSTWYDWKTLYDFLSDPKNKEKKRWWQCAKFVNDYLESIWVWRYFWNENAKTRASWCNSDYAKEWTIAIFDYGHKSSDWINHWHVGIVTKVYNDWSFDVIDSNYGSDEKIQKRHVNAWSSSCKWFFDPSQQARATTTNSGLDSFEWNGNYYDVSKYSWWNQLTDDEKLTVQNLLTYQTDPSSLPKSWKDNWASNQRVRAAAAAIGRDYGYSERKYWLVKNAETKWDNAALPWWPSSANSTAMSILKAVSDSYSSLNNYDITSVNSWINTFKTETWDPTVWAMYTDMRVAASEIAKALKWWASPTTEEIKDISNLLNGNMWEAQARAVFQHFARNLYEKNESEAKKFYETTWYKPNPIYTDEAAEWMAQSMWIDLSKYYNYVSPVTTWPQDIRQKYFDWLYSSNSTNSNIDFILNG